MNTKQAPLPPNGTRNEVWFAEWTSGSQRGRVVGFEDFGPQEWRTFEASQVQSTRRLQRELEAKGYSGMYRFCTYLPDGRKLVLP